MAWDKHTIREIPPRKHGCTVRSRKVILYDVSLLGHDNRRVIRRTSVAHLDLEGSKSVALTTERQFNIANAHYKDILPINDWGCGE